jgi:hypothetical protein
VALGLFSAFSREEAGGIGGGGGGIDCTGSVHPQPTGAGAADPRAAAGPGPALAAAGWDDPGAEATPRRARQALLSPAAGQTFSGRRRNDGGGGGGSRMEPAAAAAATAAAGGLDITGIVFVRDSPTFRIRCAV